MRELDESGNIVFPELKVLVTNTANGYQVDIHAVGSGLAIIGMYSEIIAELKRRQEILIFKGRVNNEK